MARDRARAAGILFRAPDGQVLLCHRAPGHKADQNVWAYPGGGLEDGESAAQAAAREAEEETGRAVDADGLKVWTRRERGGLDFTTFLVDVDAPFEPVLNDEHDEFRWVKPAQALESLTLHEGAKIALLRFDLDEYGIARAIRAGELTSPQFYHNVLLVALRITGTGASYRKALKEFVWRDPSLYLNDEFVARCNGLPVILEHPPSQELNSDEYRERVAGSIVLPFIGDGDVFPAEEVWGIAKIYDMASAELLATQPLSTSPAVAFREGEAGGRYALADGSHILVEGKPALLDHLAICVAGVWDKGGEPSGVSNESSRGDIMATEEQHEEAEERKDAAATPENSKEGEKLDKVLTHLDSLHSRMDEMSARMDAVEKRGDAESESKSEEKDEKDEDEEKRDDAESEGEKKLEEEEREAEDKETEDTRKDEAETEDEEEKALKREARSDSDSELVGLLRDIHRRLPREMPEAERGRFVEAQARADRVAQAFGDTAPRWLNGESLLQYRRRLARTFQHHSGDWKGVDLSRIADEAALDIAERRIYADAMEAALHPADTSTPFLRPISETDRAGRKITRFVGSIEATFGPFKQRARRVTKFNRDV